mmetsp:Transcript_19602/g.41204  ORF Transcript_19602/g.41204 Transcript_19602/m.41204 type:complete len:185 (+) Transcript_19602:140-694(+)
MTKLNAIATIIIAATSTSGFTLPQQQQYALRTPSCSSTKLNLFGSKNKDPSNPSGGANQPGMMDQLAMFKKAQEIAQKKNALDKELSNEKIVGTAADGKIQITVKYIPPQLPANPTPGYEAANVEIDEGYLESVSAEDLSKALVEAIRDGENCAMEKVAEKYKSLEEDMKGILGGMGGMAPPQK